MDFWVGRTRSLARGRLRVAWTDREGNRWAVDAALDPAWLAQRDEHWVADQPASVGSAACAHLVAWGRAHGLVVEPRFAGGRLSAEMRGSRLAVQRHGGGFSQAIAAALEQAWQQAGFRKSAGGPFVADLPRLSRRYAPRVAPLAAALLATVPGGHYATFVQRALGFVQAIPYQAGAGFWLPAGVLAEDHGDCDEKCLLLLALLRAAFPYEYALVVFTSTHALLGVPLDAGPHRFRSHGRTWALCEPAGPQLSPVGEASPNTMKALKARDHELFVVP